MTKVTSKSNYFGGEEVAGGQAAFSYHGVDSNCPEKNQEIKVYQNYNGTTRRT